VILIASRNLVDAHSDDTKKPQRMTKEVITRGWLRDALDKALNEDVAKPSPVQQFAFNVKAAKWPTALPFR
jgi:hypothetical protein